MGVNKTLNKNKQIKKIKIGVNFKIAPINMATAVITITAAGFSISIINFMLHISFI